MSLTDIEKDLGMVNRATLYHTLKIFEEKGLTRVIDDCSGILKYVLCLEEECAVNDQGALHIRFHCTSCKENSGLPGSKFPDIQLPAGFIALEMNFFVKGV